jgi:hypothetical protein
MDREAWTKIRLEADEFVTAQGGSWDHEKWLGFLAKARSIYKDVNENQMGALLDVVRRQYLSPVPNDLEAIKLLGDWSQWLVAVETTSITIIAALWKMEGLGKLHWSSRVSLTLMLFFFFISITAAVTIRLCIPAIVRKLPAPPGKDVYHMGSWEGVKGRPLYFYVQAQSWCFIVGLICFAFALVYGLWLGPNP